ncbi:MAG: hypothetical protein D6808_03135 [Candidatus Dadabacteria bacterium]|nr:MAG: hypothetical protein D6808_03135 [Candidatus Dadabacteria bacterium]
MDLKKIFWNNTALSRSFENISLLVVFFLVAYANYMVFLAVPNERIMGPVQRIFYFHVGCAVATYMAVAFLFFASLGYLTTRSALMDILGESATEIALVFCSIVMATGMIWGKAAWNTAFRWEPRLVSFLILLVILVAIVVLRRFGNPQKTPLNSAVMGILAAINVPIVVFSVKLLPASSQLHPQVVQNRGLRDPLFVKAMIIGIIAMCCFQLILLWIRVRLGLAESQLDELETEKLVN